MPRGVRKNVSHEEKLAACEARIEKLTAELKEAKAEKRRLEKEQQAADEAEIIQAYRESGKNKTEFLAALLEA